MLEVIATAIRQQREIKGIQSHNEEVKPSLFEDDMKLYMENRKDSTPKLQELIQQFSNVAAYKINVQKSVAFLHTNNENTERETRESIPFTGAPRTIIHLGMTLTEEVKDLYLRSYRTLRKETEEDTEGWKSVPRSWIRYST